ncbi:MAG: penicillin-insensitive murein endopeptidase [Pseudomonadota bacterium]
MGALGAPDTAVAQQARPLFSAERAPSAGPPIPIGAHANGCLAGGIALAESGPGWQAVRLSRNRNWGHPATIAFLERLGASALGIGWPGILIGDISQPRGGPVSGHSSHQIGLDADVWLRRPARRPLSLAEREQLGSTNVVAGNGRRVTAAWTAEHHALVKAAASDSAVARIFVNPAIKLALCEREPAGDRAWLRKIRSWSGHNSHMHIRLSCPAGATACVDQSPPPPGDGCGAELMSWFEPPDPNAAPPRRTGPPRGRNIALADMPSRCVALVR